MKAYVGSMRPAGRVSRYVHPNLSPGNFKAETRPAGSTRRVVGCSNVIGQPEIVYSHSNQRSAHFNRLKVRNGAGDIPVVVLQTILGELQIQARAKDEILHQPTLGLRLHNDEEYEQTSRASKIRWIRD